MVKLMRYRNTALAAVGLGLILTLLVMSMYNAESFPGFHGGGSCDLCHNDPQFVLPVDEGVDPDQWPDAEWLEEHTQYSTNYIPLGGNYGANHVFMKVQTLKNSTHVFIITQMEDVTLNTTGSTDKLAIIFNIDVTNFSVGDFMDGSSLSSGEMAFSNGMADMWFWDAGVLGPNGSDSGIGDYYIDTNHYNEDTDQDLTIGAQYGDLGAHSDNGYFVTFIRELTTDDANDVQFKEGEMIEFAVAYWNGSGYASHISSFDKSLVVGDELGVTEVVTETETEAITETTTEKETVTTTSVQSSTSAFTLVIAISALLIAIPVVARYRRK